MGARLPSSVGGPYFPEFGKCGGGEIDRAWQEMSLGLASHNCQRQAIAGHPRDRDTLTSTHLSIDLPFRPTTAAPELRT
jgi:hypothetical protein